MRRPLNLKDLNQEVRLECGLQETEDSKILERRIFSRSRDGEREDAGGKNQVCLATFDPLARRTLG